MDKKEVKAVEQETTAFVLYRGIKIFQPQAKKCIKEYMDYKFKIGPYGSVEIVEAGLVDKQAEVEMYKDKCGISFVTQMALKAGILPSDLPFSAKEGEFADITGYPQTMSEAKAIVAEAKQTQNVLDQYAKNLGLSTQELITKYQDGTLNDFISKKEEVVNNE